MEITNGNTNSSPTNNAKMTTESRLSEVKSPASQLILCLLAKPPPFSHNFL